jgi:hypothetical protein
MKNTMIVFALVLAVAPTGCNLKPKDDGQPRKKTRQPVQAVAQQPQAVPPPEAEKKPLGPVFAHEIFNDYLDDPQAARQKWSGQDVLVVGHVWDVDRSGGKVVMSFAVTDYQTSKVNNYGVQAFFTPPVGFGDLAKADRVLFQGRCNGKALGSVNFGNCKFIRKVDPNEFK